MKEVHAGKIAINVWKSKQNRSTVVHRALIQTASSVAIVLAAATIPSQSTILLFSALSMALLNKPRILPQRSDTTAQQDSVVL